MRLEAGKRHTENRELFSKAKQIICRATLSLNLEALDFYASPNNVPMQANSVMGRVPVGQCRLVSSAGRGEPAMSSAKF